MDNIRLTTTLPATPKDVYDAWLSSLGHTAMTGAPATSEAQVGGKHTAWDGYISGQHVELDPGRRILQTWRTTEFPTSAPDSLLEIVLTRIADGTHLTLIQTGIPDGQGEQYHEGWQDHYFAPMRAHFVAAKPKRRAEKAKPAKTKKAPAARAKAKAKPKTRATKATQKAPTARAKAKPKPKRRAKKATAKTSRPARRTKAAKK